MILLGEPFPGLKNEVKARAMCESRMLLKTSRGGLARLGAGSRTSSNPIHPSQRRLGAVFVYRYGVPDAPTPRPNASIRPLTIGPWWRSCAVVLGLGSLGAGGVAVFVT
jgi:hypothetical protein